ncbi:hypothetical protein [Streptomyces triculaminicus]|uniref:hypothetical protein n=1 Tax=Streptomyces triculaminicus TaxID=2816232 RepID=UPI0037D0C330
MAPVTLCWAVAQGGFAVGRVVGGARGAWLSWFVLFVAALGVVAVVVARRSGARRVVRGLLWTACALSAVSGFTLLMDVIGLLVGQGVDNTADAVHHALGLIGAVLLAATARSLGAGAVCGRCGQRHTAAVRPDPSAASRRMHLVACAGSVAFVPFAAMKVIWATGGTFAGVSGEEVLAAYERNGSSGVWLTLESWGLDPTALLAALGVFLLFGLIRPWGQAFPRWTLVLGGRPVPRWLPLTPAVVGAATLVPYGVLGAAYMALATTGAVTMRLGDFRSESQAIAVGWVGFGAFAVYGVALLLATRSYWLRTRPVCGAGAPGRS